MAIEIADICRYPLKGLNAEKLERVALTPGEGLPHDRRFALAHGSTRFDPSAPEWLPKTNFLCLMRDEKLAQLRAEFDPESGTMAIHRANGPRRVATGGADQLGGQALAIVQQNLEQMLGGDLLVATAQCQPLGGLNEATGAFREDL